MDRTGTLYCLNDTKIGGFITWCEKGTSAIMMFTTGDKAEEYIAKTYPGRPISVYKLSKTRMKSFVQSMVNSGIEYALIDVPWQHFDAYNEYDDEVVRNYGIVDLNAVAARMM